MKEKKILSSSIIICITVISIMLVRSTESMHKGKPLEPSTHKKILNNIAPKQESLLDKKYKNDTIYEDSTGKGLRKKPYILGEQREVILLD